MTSTSTVLTPKDIGLLPIAIKTLLGKTQIDFDLYIWPSKSRPPFMYREKHFPLDDDDLQRLLDRNIATLYMRAEHAESYCQHVRANVIADESIPAAERYRILKQATQAVIMTAFANGDVDDVATKCGDLGRDMVALICGRKNVLNDLFAVMTHDYYTFTHITNVCTCCLALAEAVGIHDETQLTEIAQGALLHDLGKCFVPPAVLNKATSLTAEEQAVMRQHPTRGFQELCLRSDVSWGQLMMVYQHHERINGSGYPVGLVGSEIHELGRICAVADVYDALTRDRPYRKGVDTKDVLAYLDRESGRSFDEEICQCWIATLKQCQL